GGAAGTRRQIRPFDDGDAVAVAGGKPGDGEAGDATAHDHQVEHAHCGAFMTDTPDEPKDTNVAEAVRQDSTTIPRGAASAPAPTHTGVYSDHPNDSALARGRDVVGHHSQARNACSTCSRRTKISSFCFAARRRWSGRAAT